MKKHRLFTVAGFIISALLLYFSLRGVKFREIIDVLKSANWALLAIPLLCIGISVILCAYRWARLSGSSVSFHNSFVALMIGLFVNNVLPARLGEVARGYVLSKKEGLSFTYSLSTVFLDRFFDLGGLLLLAFIFFPKQGLPQNIHNGIYILIGILVISVAAIIVLTRENTSRLITERLAKSKKALFRKLAQRISEIQGNLKRVHSIKNLIRFLVISFFIWFSMSIALYFVLYMLNIKIQFSYIPFVCALVNLGLTLPSSPGYIGVYQFLIVYLLSIFGISKHEGLTTSLIYHALWFVPYSVVGFLYTIKEHIKMQELQKLDEEAE